MEVKINREIREYTEAVFFGLSLRQIIFFCLCARGSSSRFLSFEAYVGNGNDFVDLYSRRSSICCAGLCEVPLMWL